MNNSGEDQSTAVVIGVVALFLLLALGGGGYLLFARQKAVQVELEMRDRALQQALMAEKQAEQAAKAAQAARDEAQRFEELRKHAEVPTEEGDPAAVP